MIKKFKNKVFENNKAGPNFIEQGGKIIIKFTDEMYDSPMKVSKKCLNYSFFSED